MYEQLSLSDAIGETPQQATERREALRAKLQTLAREMLEEDRDKGGPGVTFHAVRLAAETRGWLTGEEKRGHIDLSFGSALMKAAGGIVAAYVKGKHAKAQRRRVAAYKLERPDVEDGA